MPRLAPVFLATWLALLCAYAVPVEGTYGLDISSYLSINDFGCLKNNSYQFAIIRAYQSIGETIVIYSANTHTDYGGGNAYLYLCMSCCIGRAVWGASLRTIIIMIAVFSIWWSGSYIRCSVHYFTAQ